MKNITLVVLSAGNSSRFKLKTKKQWLRIENKPLWLFVTDNIVKDNKFDNIIVVGHRDEISYMNNFNDKYKFVAGGDTRQGSIKNAMKYVDTKYLMITDVARCCIPNSVIKNLIANKNKADVIVPILKASDTIVYKNDTINRDEVKIIQTPQLSTTKKLRKALKTDIEFTDESSAIKNIGGKVFYIDGDIESKKLTFGNETNDISCLKKPSKNNFVGFGIDTHKFEKNKQMYLGSVKIDVDYGFKAHSDGDLLIHSIIDAILGAIGAGDIGEFFPDNDPKYKNIDSKILLEYILEFIVNVGYQIINIDLTIIAEQPKINPYKNKIRSEMAKLLNISKQNINIKATTSEKMGFIGRGEGVTVQSIANLKYYDWKENNEYTNS